MMPSVACAPASPHARTSYHSVRPILTLGIPPVSRGRIPSLRLATGDLARTCENEAPGTGKKTPGGAGTHTGHTGTRITQTNLTTIQTTNPRPSGAAVRFVCVIRVLNRVPVCVPCVSRLPPVSFFNRYSCTYYRSQAAACLHECCLLVRPAPHSVIGTHLTRTHGSHRRTSQASIPHNRPTRPTNAHTHNHASGFTVENTAALCEHNRLRSTFKA